MCEQVNETPQESGRTPEGSLADQVLRSVLRSQWREVALLALLLRQPETERGRVLSFSRDELLAAVEMISTPPGGLLKLESLGDASEAFRVAFQVVLGTRAEAEEFARRDDDQLASLDRLLRNLFGKGPCGCPRCTTRRQEEQAARGAGVAEG